jgi:hypothetical protein
MKITSDGIRDQLGRREFVGMALGAFVVASIPLARRRPAGVVRRAMPVMGTIAQFAVVSRDEHRAHAAIDAAMDELQWVERTMTRFTDHSDIGRANLAAARDAVVVSAETALVTREGLRWASALDGRYDPAAGAIVKLWDVRHRHTPPADALVAELAARGVVPLPDPAREPASPRNDLQLRLENVAVELDLPQLRHQPVGKVLRPARVDAGAAGVERPVRHDPCILRPDEAAEGSTATSAQELVRPHRLAASSTARRSSSSTGSGGSARSRVASSRMSSRNATQVSQ